MKKIGIIALLALLALSMFPVNRIETTAQEPYRQESAGKSSFGFGEQSFQAVAEDPQLFVEAMGGQGLDFGRSVAQTPIGDFVITGPWSYSGGAYSDLSLIHVDSSGNPVCGGVLKGPPTNNKFETGSSVIAPSWLSYSTGDQANEDNDNDIPATADPINLGDGYDGSIGPAGDKDYVMFNAKAGTILFACAMHFNYPSPTLQPTLKLFGSDGATQLAASTTITYDYVALASLTFTIRNDGDHYLVVGGTGTGDYSLSTTIYDVVVVGHSNSFGLGFDAVIARFNSSSTFRWAKALSPPPGATTFGLSVTDTSDQSFVITGPIWGYPDGAGMDLYIVKFDANGNFLWDTVVAGSGDDCGSSVIEASDGDLVVTGWTTSFGTMDLLLARFSASGSVRWAKAYDGGGDDCGESVIEEDLSKDLFVTGATNSFGAGGNDLLLARFDEDGNPVWTRTLGGSNDDHGHSLVRTWCGGSHVPVASPPAPVPGLCDFGIAVAGVTKSFGQGGEDLLAAMFDLNGNCRWAKTLDALDPGTTNDGGLSLINAYSSGSPLFREIVQTNCRLVFTGYTFSWGRGEDILLGAFDYYGHTARDKTADVQIVNSPLSPVLSPSFDVFQNTLAATDITDGAVAQSVTPDLTATTICTTSFTQFTDVGPINQPVVFEFAVITDTHLRYGTDPPYNQLRTTVQRINEAVNAGEDIRFVMVLGDIGDEGYRCRSDPYVRVKQVLDELLIPYIPVTGNHDVWYDYPEDTNRDWFENRQEEIFNQIFSSHYDYLSTVLPGWTKAPTPVQHTPPNAPGPVNSYFQNFAFDYMKYHLICLDSNSRNDIYTSDLAHPETRGFPDLHGDASGAVPGGTWDWLFNHLATYQNKGDENILLFAHQPLSFVASKNDGDPYHNYNTFNSIQYQDIIGELGQYAAYIDKWFAGHWHIGDGNVTDLEGRQIFQCCEEDITDDVVSNLGSSILTNVVTRSASPFPMSPGENIRLVRVHDDLKVDFDFGDVIPIPGWTVDTPISFEDQSTAPTTDPIVSWFWRFGDGVNNQNQHPPPHQYSTPGLYKVTLEVTTQSGRKGSMAKTVDVGTRQLVSEDPGATAYNNARKLVFDPENGMLHLVYTTGPAPGSLTYINSKCEGNTWFEVTRALMWGGHPALDVNTLGNPCVIENWAGIGSGFNAKRRENPLGWFSYTGTFDSDVAFGYPSMVVDSENNLHIVISRRTATSSDIVYYVISPGGKIIKGPETVPSSTTGECSFPSIALVRTYPGAPEAILVVWQQGSSIWRNWRYHYSVNVQQPWGTPMQISTQNVQAKNPSIVANGTTHGGQVVGAVHVVWQESDGSTAKVVNKTLVSWFTWDTEPPGLPPETVSILSSPNVDSYPQAVFGDNTVYVVWADMVTAGDYDIFYSRKTAAGWSDPENLSGTSTIRSQHPQAAIIPGATLHLCVVWTEGNSPPYMIRFSAIGILKTDINGDGKVNILDISTAARAFGSHGPDIPNPGDPPSDRWNAIADLNKDGWVNIIDISMIAVDFGKPH